MNAGGARQVARVLTSTILGATLTAFAVVVSACGASDSGEGFGGEPPDATTTTDAAADSEASSSDGDGAGGGKADETDGAADAHGEAGKLSDAQTVIEAEAADDGSFDASAGEDGGGSDDAGEGDSGLEGGSDSGSGGASDAGHDAGVEAGSDASIDSGPPPCGTAAWCATPVRAYDYNCGTVSDVCGDTITCGTCPTYTTATPDSTCGNAGTNRCGPPDCITLSEAVIAESYIACPTAPLVQPTECLAGDGVPPGCSYVATDPQGNTWYCCP